jgi:hypothetical protein
VPSHLEPIIHIFFFLPRNLFLLQRSERENGKFPRKSFEKIIPENFPVIFPRKMGKDAKNRPLQIKFMKLYHIKKYFSRKCLPTNGIIASQS